MKYVSRGSADGPSLYALNLWTEQLSGSFNSNANI